MTSAIKCDRTITRTRKAVLVTLLVVVALSTLGVSGPASAHTGTWTGTLYGQVVFINPVYSPDYWAWEGTCTSGNHTDGSQYAFIDISGFRNHKVTVSVTGSTQGTASQREAGVIVGYEPCPTVSQAPSVGNFGIAKWGRPLNLTVPPSAFYIGIYNANTAVGLTYRVTAVNP